MVMREGDNTWAGGPCKMERTGGVELGLTLWTHYANTNS